MPAESSVHREHKVQSFLTKYTVAVVAVALVLALVVLKPGAPKQVVLLTGPEGSSYHDLGQRYATALERSGLPAIVVETAGGLDNLRRIAKGTNDTVALAPSNVERGAEESMDISHLESLGSVAYEPLWIIYRAGLEVDEIRDFEGARLATGSRGSVAAYLARTLLEANGIDEAITQVDVDFDDPDALAEAIRQGPFDVAIITGRPDSPIIRALLASERFELLSVARADAYAARYPGLMKLVAPRGVFDLEKDVPDKETQLLAATTNLVASDDLHPAIVPIMLRAATEVHGGEFLVGNRGDFPGQLEVSLPLAPAALRYYNQGETGLTKNLPYKVSRWLNHLGFVVIPLLAVAFVLVKILPVLMRTWVTIRLTGLYKRLEAVEKADAERRPRSELLGMLEEIDRASATIFIPRNRLPEYIDFRQFMHDMRERIAAGGERDLDEPPST